MPLRARRTDQAPDTLLQRVEPTCELAVARGYRACVRDSGVVAWKNDLPGARRFCSNSRHVRQGFAIKCRRFSPELTITLCSRPSRPSTLLSLITQLTSRHALCYHRHHGRLVVPGRVFSAYQSVRYQFAAHDAASRFTCQP
jgi:hypothetical protein